MEARRRHYLQLMGITPWHRRAPVAPPQEAATGASRLAIEPPPADSGPLPFDMAAGEQPGHPSGHPGTAGGSRPAAAPPVPDRPPAATLMAAQAAALRTLDLDALRERVSGCTACTLHGSRTQTVFGVGDARARLFIIGEAPGAEEDRQGEPFVGRAGQLLNAMLAAIGLDREAVFIANILKCRPPRNRDPSSIESAACMPYLMRQIELVAPRVLLAVGRVAAQGLLASDTPIGRMRGRTYSFGPRQIPLLVTYHPAYLLRSPDQKGKVWSDLKRLRTMLEEVA